MLIELTVNGQPRHVDVPSDEPLLVMLRDRLYLTGSKDGCSEGECGACTVLLDGMPVDSCIYPAAAAAGREVLTVEGLRGSDGQLHPLQQAFVEQGAIQCGFCTPGFLMTLTALLAENPTPDRETVQSAISGNICRCTGYEDILSAVATATGQEL